MSVAADAIPVELGELAQWVAWRTEVRGGDPTKVPYQALQPDRRASTTDPATWATLTDALYAAAQWPGIDGIGFVFCARDPYAGVDLDDCLGEDGLHSDAGAILACLDSYAELSPRGHGVKTIVRASLDGFPRHVTDKTGWGGKFEVYDQRRFFTLTGDLLHGCPATVEPRQEQLDRVLQLMFGDLAPYAPLRQPPRPVDVADQELLERAFDAANGDDIRRLYNGAWQDRYGSQSEADLALCAHLAFWTDKDPARIDRLFRSSGLMRDKWLRDDYRAGTIELAVAGCDEVYEAPARNVGPASLEAVGAKVTLRQSAVDKPGADVSDHLAAGPNADELEPLPGDAGAPAWNVQAWPDFRDTAPQSHRWLIEGLLPEGALVFIAGPPKKGKTWLGIALALAVATGRPLFGEYEVPEARDVLYVALEGSRVGLRARIGALTRGLDLDPDSSDLDRLHMLYRPRPFDLVDGSSDDDFATAVELFKTASDVRAALVIIDVLRTAARFKENEQAEFARVRDAIEPLLTAGRSVPVLHHFGKLSDTQQQRSPGERMAGTGAMEGALDVGFMITRSESGARRLRVEIEARDFAAPDPLGVVIAGTGTGEHGGFTYLDEAKLMLDDSATEARDLAGEIEALFADGTWRIVDEIKGKAKGIAAQKEDVREALADPRFVLVEGPRVGRHATAKPYGTIAMLRTLEEAEEVAPTSGPPGPPQLVLDHEAAGGAGSPPSGLATGLPAQPEHAGRPGPPAHPGHLPDADEIEGDA